jgi:hypothetical protein
MSNTAGPQPALRDCINVLSLGASISSDGAGPFQDALVFEHGERFGYKRRPDVDAA